MRGTETPFLRTCVSGMIEYLTAPRDNCPLSPCACLALSAKAAIAIARNWAGVTFPICRPNFWKTHAFTRPSKLSAQRVSAFGARSYSSIA